MWGRIDGRAKMELAKEALAGALNDVPLAMPVGLRAYGHRVAYDEREAGCQDTELLIAPQPGSAQRILARSAALQPRGQTPLALSLRAAADDLSEGGGGVYFDAPSAEQLFRGVGAAVRTTTDLILAGGTSLSFPPLITRVSGGGGADTAEEIEPGTYSFTEHLFHEQRYFAVRGEPGEQLVLAGLVCALAIGRTD
jgi:hypothetical protein